MALVSWVSVGLAVGLAAHLVRGGFPGGVAAALLAGAAYGFLGGATFSLFAGADATDFRLEGLAAAAVGAAALFVVPLNRCGRPSAPKADGPPPAQPHGGSDTINGRPPTRRS